MAHVVIYTSPFCGYCHRAKRVLAGKGAEFEEVDLVQQPARRDEMVERAQGRATVPQIFIDGRHVGGHEELVTLERTGDLDKLLGRP